MDQIEASVLFSEPQSKCIRFALESHYTWMMGNVLNQRPMFLAFFLLSLLLVLFQNCSSSLHSAQVIKNQSKLSGNGGGYEGKPTYYRFIPDMTCNGEMAPKEMLVFESDSIWLFENQVSGLACNKTKTQIQSSDVVSSPFQIDFLIVHDFLYALMDPKSEKEPSVLAESLCRDNWDAPRFEIVNHHNLKTGEATTRIYYKAESSEEVQIKYESSTQRLLTPFEVNYHSFDQKIKYVVNFKSAHGPFGRKYSGRMTYVDPIMQDILKVGGLECVTGGGLDSSVWPIRKVNISSTISNFLVHPTENDLYFEDRSPSQVNWWRPFVLKNETKVIDISTEIFKTSMYVGSNLPIEKSKWMALEGIETDGTPYFGGNTYIYNPGDPSSVRTLAKSQSRNSFIPNQTVVVSRINQLSENEFGYWMVNRIFTSQNTPAQETYFYRIFNWKTSNSTDFLVSKNTQRVSQSFYFGSEPWPKGIVGHFKTSASGSNEILYMDINSRLEKTLVLPQITNCQPEPMKNNTQNQTFISKNSRVAVVQYTCLDHSRKVIGVSLETNFFYVIEGYQGLLWVAPDGEDYIVGETLTDSYQQTKYNPLNLKMIKTQSGIVETTAIDPHLITSNDQLQFKALHQFYYGSSAEIKTFRKSDTKYIAGFTSSFPWSVQLKNLRTRKETTVCKNAIGEKLDLLNFTDDQLVLVSFVPGQKILIYEVSESENCRLMNSSYVKYNAIKALRPTRSGLGVASSTTPNRYSHSVFPDDIYFLNKDGRSPLHINLNAPDFNIIVDMQVSFDQSKLYILGAGKDSSILQSLFWLML